MLQVGIFTFPDPFYRILSDSQFINSQIQDVKEQKQRSATIPVSTGHFCPKEPQGVKLILITTRSASTVAVGSSQAASGCASAHGPVQIPVNE